jgi:hypothetical protein
VQRKQIIEHDNGFSPFFVVLGFELRALDLLGALPLESRSQPFFCFSYLSDRVSGFLRGLEDQDHSTSTPNELYLFLEMGLCCLPGLASNHEPPLSASQVDGILGMSDCTRLFFVFNIF